MLTLSSFRPGQSELMERSDQLWPGTHCRAGARSCAQTGGALRRGYELRYAAGASSLTAVSAAGPYALLTVRAAKTAAGVPSSTIPSCLNA